MTQQAITTNAPQNGAPIQQAQAPKGSTLQQFLESPAVKQKLAEVAANFMTPEALIRLALMAASRQPDLLKCSPTSVLRALMDAAALGIVPGGNNGRGFLVPRKNRHNGQTEATFDPGYRGLEDIAKRSGKITRIETQAVYAQDVFQVELGINPTLKHVPNFAAEDRGEIVAGYAVAYFADGAHQIEVLTKSDIAAIQAMSMAQSGPWKAWRSEMVRKSCSRRICKRLPVYDPIMDKALQLADEADDNDIGSTHPQLMPGDTKSLEDALMGTNTSTVTPDGEIVDDANKEKA